MRRYTFFFSIVVHGLIVVAAIVVPVVATDRLPAPRRAEAIVIVKPAPPPPEPRPIAHVDDAHAIVSPSVAPIEPPAGIRQEEPPELPSSPAVIQGFEASVIPTPEPAPPPAPQPTRATEPVHVGGAIRPPQKIVHVTPEYPSIARAAHVSGIVILEAIIREDGKVGDVRVLRSIPLLDEAALRAVRQWVFSPTLLNGQPVPVVMTVTVSFSLK